MKRAYGSFYKTFNDNKKDYSRSKGVSGKGQKGGNQISQRSICIDFNIDCFDFQI